MPPPRGFARGDFDTSFPLDDRFQELAVILSRSAYLQAVGAYWLLIASAWRDACRKPVERVAVGVPERVVAALLSVGLLDDGHLLPEGSFDRWVGSALERRRTNTESKGRERTPSDSDGLRMTPTDSALARAPAYTVGAGSDGEEKTKTERVSLSGRQRVHAWLTEHGAAAPVGWANTSLNEMVKVYGPEAITTLWASAPADVRTSRQFVQYAERNLGPAKGASKGLGPTTTEAENAFTG